MFYVGKAPEILLLISEGGGVGVDGGYFRNLTLIQQTHSQPSHVETLYRYQLDIIKVFSANKSQTSHALKMI